MKREPFWTEIPCRQAGQVTKSIKRKLTRQDQGWMNTRRVREELVLRIQNGGLTTQRDTKKRREPFLVWPILTGILTLKWVKVSIPFNSMFFLMIRDYPSRVKH